MIKAEEEIRIGNLILFEEDGTECEVHELDHLGCNVSSINEAFYSEYNNFNGIPLTEEHLLKFGNAEMGIFPDGIVIYDRFLFLWKESYKYWYVITKEHNEYLTKIEFLHEYQNFIYVMTGEELIINSL